MMHFGSVLASRPVVGAAVLVEDGEDDPAVVLHFLPDRPRKSADDSLPVDDCSTVVHRNRRASVGPTADALHRRLEGRQEAVAESRVLLFVPGLRVDQLSRGERVVLDSEAHRELRLAATCSSTSLQLKVLTSPAAIC